MSTTTRKLRAASDGVLRDLDALVRLERAKRELDAGDPRRVELSTKIEAITRRVVGLVNVQGELVRQIDFSDVPEQAPAIVETPREAAVILDEWRGAERRLADVEPGSPEAEIEHATIKRLRDEYRRATGG